MSAAFQSSLVRRSVSLQEPHITPVSNYPRGRQAGTPPYKPPAEKKQKTLSRHPSRAVRVRALRLGDPRMHTPCPTSDQRENQRSRGTKINAVPPNGIGIIRTGADMTGTTRGIEDAPIGADKTRARGSGIGRIGADRNRTRGIETVPIGADRTCSRGIRTDRPNRNVRIGARTTCTRGIGTVDIGARRICFQRFYALRLHALPCSTIALATWSSELPRIAVRDTTEVTTATKKSHTNSK